MLARAPLVPPPRRRFVRRREVLSTWMREGRFNLELANVHAYALTCKLAGGEHPTTPLEIFVS
jgi:hypothetical protein